MLRGWIKVIVCGGLATLSNSQAFSQVAYNEVFQANGQLRPAYQQYFERTGLHPLNVSQNGAQALTLNPMGDRISILPIPVVLADSEYQMIQRGVRQRAKTLQLLFADLFINPTPKVFNSPLILPEGVPPLSENLIRGISESEGYSFDLVRSTWQGMSLEDIHFTYGPDLVRNPEGQWVAIEDNIGPVGGIGDVDSVIETFDSKTGHRAAANLNFSSDLVRFVEHFTKKHALKKELILALIVQSPKRKSDDRNTGVEYDLENNRKAAILKGLGIESHSSDEILEKLSGLSPSEINALINFSTESSSNVDKVKFLRLFTEKRTKFFNSPFTDIVSSKAFTPYMDALIKFYLGEEPIIKTQESYPLETRTPESESRHLRRLVAYGPDELAKWVLKRIDGVQGRQVHVLGKMNELQLQGLDAEIAEYSAFRLSNHRTQSFFILQRFVPVSYLPAESNSSWLRFTIDLRPITSVQGNDILVSERSWARSNFDLGANLNNVSQGAFEARVIREICELSLVQ